MIQTDVIRHANDSETVMQKHTSKVQFCEIKFLRIVRGASIERPSQNLSDIRI